MTGGGPGIMEAANKGAFEAGGLSGCNIRLPMEQKPNLYARMGHYGLLFREKIFAPQIFLCICGISGGWGTMDELLETLNLVQTGMIQFSGR